jgi:hypothetical protein
MKQGRLIRVGARGDAQAISYVVGAATAAEAVAIMRASSSVAAGTEVEDLGDVSDGLAAKLNVQPGDIVKL